MRFLCVFAVKKSLTARFRKIALALFAIFLYKFIESVSSDYVEIMRYIYLPLFLVLCFAPASQAELSMVEPYTALITADGVAVRSGPGIDFYPVLQLQTGDNVKVYYEQGEWCAIRPPIGSFSWVSAAYVDFGTGNIGTVLADGLASRIGSDYSDDCDAVQIALKRGETVLILERRETPENLASPVWLKIAPPSGEFRWIHRSAIRSNAAIRQVRHEDGDSQIPLQIQQIRSEMSNSAMAAHIPELPRASSPERSSIPVPRLAAAQSVSATQQSAPVTQRSTSGTVIDPFQRAFNELQREAYVVMTRPTDDEVFALLIHRAEELYQIAPTDIDLEKTYHLLESLQRTRIVRRELALRRSAPVRGNQSAVPSLLQTPLSQIPARPAPAAAPAEAPVAAPSTTTAGTPAPQRQSVIPAYTPTAAQSSLTPLQAGVNVAGYDIVGQLGEFEPPIPEGHPPFAVVDERERIICLISPSANLDLLPHVGQFVGINGVLGYDRILNARHITAREVKVLR